MAKRPPAKKTYHCIGCRNPRNWGRDIVDETCCTCCRDEQGNRPGRGVGVD